MFLLSVKKMSIIQLISWVSKGGGALNGCASAYMFIKVILWLGQTAHQPFNACSNFVPSGLPQPVQASQPGPAG